MTDNSGTPTTRRSVALEERHVDPQRQLDLLRLEVAELRASLRRVVLAADADRSRIERDLHAGVQQDLVALAVNLQLASQLVDTDPGAAKMRLEEMGRDVQQALGETAQLAQRIYPHLLEASGLAVALRSAASSAGIPTTIEVDTDAGYPLEVGRTVYLCCVEVLELAAVGTQATVTVRDEEGAVAFEVVAGGDHSDAGLDRARDRIEALGGRLTVQSEAGGGTRVSASLPTR